MGGAETRTLLPTDYESIHAAVVETTRGRWFLEEFARRNRQSDTQLILNALRDLAAGFAHTVDAFASAPPHRTEEGHEVGHTPEPLLQRGREALVAMLAAAERIQEAAWLLQAKGADAECCAVIDAQVRAIYTAAPLQELSLLGLSHGAGKAA
ncbi:hypothetical protein GCM10007036_18420 [Alsobacter metallidurans]|uniref:Uncharacterized protein n=1 Tax=Alsobacter metallidurans TaxID=340221 RepID=A0A917I708_9HYPH|nr:hypothetical protein [Alsobacter metallidurans]GGH17173.1 hypothetical protein GCM10007036_18420 [Alsobacter metallidurans]